MPTPDKKPSSSKRLPSLDGLRAVAAILVVLYHAAFFGAGFPDTWRPLATLLPGGGWAVQLFFFISGFIITHLILTEEHTLGRINIWTFFARRALRLLPVYILYLSAVWFASHYGSEPVSLSTYIAALTFTYDCWGHAPSYVLGHLWSLSVEEQFYIVWPFVLLLVRDIRWRQRLLLCIVLFAPLVRGIARRLYAGDFAGIPLFYNADSLAFGCLLAFAIERVRQFSQRQSSTVLAAVESGLVAFMVSEQYLFHRNTLGPLTAVLTYAHNIAMFLFVGIVIVQPTLPLARLLNWKPLTYIGLMSYSMYMWQQLFTQPHLGGKGAFGFAFPSNCVATVMCAIASYQLVEKPFLRLRRYIKDP